MASLIGFLIFILVCAAILGGIVGLVSRLQRPRQPKFAADWQPPTADLLPYSKQKYFFSAAERSFYEILKRLAPAEHTVFAKVRLADVVHVNGGAPGWQSHFNRISGKHVDFLLCNNDLAPVLAIELDDKSHGQEDRQSRDYFVDQALAAAALPVLRVQARRGYVIDEVREMLRPYLPLMPASAADLKK